MSVPERCVVAIEPVPSPDPAVWLSLRVPVPPRTTSAVDESGRELLGPDGFVGPLQLRADDDVAQVAPTAADVAALAQQLQHTLAQVPPARQP